VIENRRAATILETVATEQGWGHYRKLALLEEFCESSALAIITEAIDHFGHSEALEDFLCRKAEQQEEEDLDGVASNS
jgi:hypothetical protein